MNKGILILTRTARVRLIVVTYHLTERRPVNVFINLAADAGKLMLYVEILQRFAETEVGENDVEDPFESVADVFCAKAWYLQNKNCQNCRRTCRSFWVPCQFRYDYEMAAGEIISVPLQISDGTGLPWFTSFYGQCNILPPRVMIMSPCIKINRNTARRNVKLIAAEI